MPVVRAAVLRHYGTPSAPGAGVDTASVTFLGLEPIEILRIPDGEFVHYVTLGGARHPMTDPAAAVADPMRGPRVELVLTLRGGVSEPEAAAERHRTGASHTPRGHGVAGLTRGLGVLIATPAVEGVVLRADALLDLGEPLWRGAAFTAALLGPSDIAPVALPEPADPVHFLSVAPITATEAAWVRLRGVAALREAWAEAGIDVRDPDRGAASL